MFHGAGVPIVKDELLKPSSGFIVPFSIGQSLNDSHLVSTTSCHRSTEKSLLVNEMRE